MLDRIKELLAEAEEFSANSLQELEEFRIKYLSKKGSLSQLFADFKDVSNDKKKDIGQALNELKQLIQQKVDRLKAELSEGELITAIPDLTLPGESMALGARHPISIVRGEILEIFSRLGFTVSNGPEIEDDWHVFTSLNFPPEHPARDMQDTFFIEKNPDILLRTQTSSIQVRVMENTKPPIRTETSQYQPGLTAFFTR
jgi:phenylalanyl-tRNA synthetase alpha chain